MYAQSGEQIARALRSRRDRLMDASREFYRLLAHDVDVRATAGAEDFEVARLADGSTSVAIYARDAKSGGRTPNPSFRRTFLPGETSEIRLYTMGGNDRVVEQGKGTDAILLRVISLPETELVDRSNQSSATKRYEPLPPPSIPKEQLARALERDPQAEERRRHEVFRDWGHDSLVFSAIVVRLHPRPAAERVSTANLVRFRARSGGVANEIRGGICDVPEPAADRVRSRFPHALAAARAPLRRVLGGRAG